MSAIDLKVTKNRIRQELTRIHDIDQLREDLRLYKLDGAPLGIQEIFKSAPKQHLIPNELLMWMKQLISEGLKVGVTPYDLIMIMRTKGIENGYSSQQVTETMDKAIDQVNDRYKDKDISKKFEKLNN